MTIKVSHILLTLTSIPFFHCNSANQNDLDIVKQSIKSQVDTVHVDKVILMETSQQDDTAFSEYLADRRKPIRENFKRINSISEWTLTDKKNLDESSEGGEVTFYYSKGVLEKIVTYHFGETFQKLTEYYLLNGHLSFVFEKSIKYNRPIYYDSTSMKENSDNQTFDFEKSYIEQDRSYFENKKLIHHANNKAGDAPFVDDYLMEEQKRIIADFERLIKMKKL